MAAHSADIENTTTSTQVDRTVASRAATAFAPSAYVSRPTRVSRMKATASTEAIAHTMMMSGIGIGPVCPMAETLLVSHPGTAPVVAPLLHSRASPDTIRLMPKLVISE